MGVWVYVCLQALGLVLEHAVLHRQPIVHWHFSGTYVRCAVTYSLQEIVIQLAINGGMVSIDLCPLCTLQYTSYRMFRVHGVLVPYFLDQTPPSNSRR